ncbi:formate dehydrogenase accessory sulfurtransferase FdhD [Rhabdothermincola salaria]|uniref:formate dehydrogenase accessory sulfurtransferase FdhD n=1 Tax=Rhabdothermincola salaria TaxID=2903142 RepID=UPI001E51C6D4|nr:formate dehydrogenase accessory sulfurtransferase FdhD [Rhabdothermincola salaria]MCD9624733.1 formate dehydrogenase accessory sulfurtransferase FdhD [Rhabdothermincola salaria]
MSRGRSETVLTRRFDGRSLRRAPDEVVVEEPLSIHLDGTLVATTMRTPGHDFELAVGFCFTEGLLGGAEVRTCRYCATGSAVETAFNVVSVDTGGLAPPPTPRLGPATSSCGLCGSQTLDELTDRLAPLPPVHGPAFEVLLAAPDLLRDAQGLFDATGSVHAAAAFTAEADLVEVREDIGRHNAVDKVVGRLLLDDHLPATGMGLVVSGRASFELVAKAWAAGFASMVAVSGPSALAVDTARRAGLVLVGFARDGGGNLYAPVEGGPVPSTGV